MERVIKPSVLSKLKIDKETNEIQIKKIKRFYVKVPDLQTHTNYPNGEVCGIGNGVHPTIIEKIHELVSAGETFGLLFYSWVGWFSFMYHGCKALQLAKKL